MFKKSCVFFSILTLASIGYAQTQVDLRKFRQVCEKSFANLKVNTTELKLMFIEGYSRMEGDANNESRLICISVQSDIRKININTAISLNSLGQLEIIYIQQSEASFDYGTYGTLLLLLTDDAQEAEIEKFLKKLSSTGFETKYNDLAGIIFLKKISEGGLAILSSLLTSEIIQAVEMSSFKYGVPFSFEKGIDLSEEDVIEIEDFLMMRPHIKKLKNEFKVPSFLQ